MTLPQRIARKVALRRPECAVRFICCLALCACGRRGSVEPGVAPVTPNGPTAMDAGADVSPSPPAPAAAMGTPSAPPALPATVTITVRTVPSVQARIRHGTRVLGDLKPGASLVLKRPRDSGPIDLVITAREFLTVHTRAYTFTDQVIDVKLTRDTEKETLFGFRQPLPPEADAGVPE
jgi:hypothetical protein